MITAEINTVIKIKYRFRYIFYEVELTLTILNYQNFQDFSSVVQSFENILFF